MLRRALDVLVGWFKRWFKPEDNASIYYEPSVRIMEPDFEFDYEELPNPNYNDRPAPVDGIIIHAAGYYIKDGDKVWFAPDFIENAGYSYHAMVDDRGKVYVCVDRDKRAWHAGVSQFQGRSDLNDSFIGFCALVRHEPLGYSNFINTIDNGDPYTDAQYESLAALCRQAMQDYPGITLDRIVRHSTVSGPDVRPDFKRDPGKSFSMDRLKAKL